ncbi:MAG: glycine zipper 2TM domain-containing protein [Gammaproteobacteria bacterium]|nr:glycine zipper 2TM domain-containing protein [Gammaproteobacteria bacterium]
MLRKIAISAAAFATFTLPVTSTADHGWWEDDADDNYHQSRYESNHRAERYDDGYVYADVVDVEPIYRYVRVRQPRQECWDERVQERPGQGYRNTSSATVAGGLVGGLIGRQFGDGKGRDAMTIVGTLVGSAIANDGANRRNYERDHYNYRQVRTRTVERCNTRYTSREERRIDGYHVSYVYAGRKYMTRTTREPARQIRVRVAVRPVNTQRY